MNLHPGEVEQYYRIWWPLLGYVNEQRLVVPRVVGKTIKGSVLSTQEAAKIRDALWADDSFPFRDKITCDGILTGYRLLFGPGLRADLNETYAKDHHPAASGEPHLDTRAHERRR